MAAKANKKPVKTSKAKPAKKPAAKTAKKLTAKAAAKKAAAKPVKKAAAKKATAKKPAAKKATKPVAKTATKPVAVNTKSTKTANIKWSNFLTPLDDRLIVEMSAAEKITAGGLYIPDTVSDMSGNYQGKVLVVGRGHRDKFGKVTPMDVKTGDVIVFAEFSGSKMELNGKDIRILRESEVLGIVSQ